MSPELRGPTVSLFTITGSSLVAGVTAFSGVTELSLSPLCPALTARRLTFNWLLEILTGRSEAWVGGGAL